MPNQYADAAHRYRLDSRIATGGMGVVYRATDTRLGREVAVKVLKTEFADDPTFRARFETEARHAASLHHPGIAGVFDYQAEPAQLAPGGAPYLVMELVEGAPLSALITQARESGRTMDAAVVRDLMAQAAEALGVAHHAGIVHRDVKPANLIVTPDRRVKVTDFGIARAGDAAQITRTGAVMGTPQYLSPEQARGNAAVPASDVYALGCVTYECLTGLRPFDAETPVATALAHLQQPVPELPAFVPADLAAVVRRALDKDPAQRYEDGTAFAAALRDPATAATEVIPPAAPVVVPTPEPATAQTAVMRPAGASAVDRPEPAAAYAGRDERAPRSPWPAVVLVLILVAGAIAIAFLLMSNGDDDTPPADDTPSRTQRTKTAETTPTESETTETTEPTEAETTETSEAPTTVTINEADYIGRDIGDVESALRTLGLEVTRNEVANDGTHTEGEVAGLNPDGTVEKGTLIVVDYYGAPPATDPGTPDDSASTESGEGE